MSQHQLYLLQGTTQLLPGYPGLKEMENPPGSQFVYMVNVVQDPQSPPLNQSDPAFLVWLEMLKLIAEYNLISTDDGIVVAVIRWMGDRELARQNFTTAESLINAAVRNSIMTRTSKITRMHAEIEKVTVELEQISSLIGRI